MGTFTDYMTRRMQSNPFAVQQQFNNFDKVFEPYIGIEGTCKKQANDVNQYRAYNSEPEREQICSKYIFVPKNIEIVAQSDKVPGPIASPVRKAVKNALQKGVCMKNKEEQGHDADADVINRFDLSFFLFHDLSLSFDFKSKESVLCSPCFHAAG